MRALFLVPWPSEAASTRLRVQQYFPYLRQAGVEPVLRPFMSPRLYEVVYRPGHLARKTALVLLSSLGRLVDLVAASRADVVVVHREAYPFGTTLVERAIAGLGVPIILDFDDAIYLPSSSAPNGFIRRMKRPQKVQDLIRLSRAVVAGNSHLARYAAAYNDQVTVIPTPVDTHRYRPRAEVEGNRVVIGWIGSGTTSRYLDTLREPLRAVLARHRHVEVLVVGGRAPQIEALPRVTYREWSLQEELKHLHQFDIGLMPYPDNEWARGKCAFKALLYMSVGIPAVCSDVGMAREVIEPGVNGYLPRTEQEWFEVLDELVAETEARRRLGAAGRELVTREYSLARHAPRLVHLLEVIAAGQAMAAPRLADPSSMDTRG